MVGSPQRPERVDIPEIHAAITVHDFPGEWADVLGRLTDRGVDERIVTIVRRLPDRVYRTPADLVDEVRRLHDRDRTASDRPVVPGAPGASGPDVS